MQTATDRHAARRLKLHGFALRIAVGALGLLTLLLFSTVVVSLIAQEPQRKAKEPEPLPGKHEPIDLQAVKPIWRRQP